MINDDLILDSVQFIEKAASDYKKQLLGSTKFSSNEEKLNLEQVQKELERLRIELTSVAHEKTIVDVLSRPILSEIEFERNRRLAGDPNRHKKLNYGAAPAATATSVPSKASKSAHIPIPAYIPPHLRHLASSPTALQLQGTLPGTAIPSTTLGQQHPSLPSSYGGAAFSRSVQGTRVVPSMKVSGFPDEIRQLKTRPIDYPSQAILPPPPSNNKVKMMPCRARRPVHVLPPPVHGLSRQEMDAALLAAKQELLASQKTYYRQRERHQKKAHAEEMKAIKDWLSCLREGQEAKDAALLSSVTELVQETLASFEEVVSEVEFLEILEEILAEVLQTGGRTGGGVIRQEGEETVGGEEQEGVYKVVQVERKVTPVERILLQEKERRQESYRLVPPVLGRQETGGGGGTKESEVQTVPFSSSSHPAPPPPSPSSLDSQLLPLLQQLVAANRENLQGQQTLWYQLLLQRQQDRGGEGGGDGEEEDAKTAAAAARGQEEKAVDTADLEDLLFSPSPVPVPPIPAIASPPPDPATIPAAIVPASAIGELISEASRTTIYPYHTGLGALLLGGRGILTAPPPYGPPAIVPRLPLDYRLRQLGLDEQGEPLVRSQEELVKVKVIEQEKKEGQEEEDGQEKKGQEEEELLRYRREYLSPARRRASPLILQYLQQEEELDRQKKLQEKEDRRKARQEKERQEALLSGGGGGGAEQLQAAMAMLLQQQQTGGGRGQEVSRQEIAEMVQTGMRTGVRQALGYFDEVEEENLWDERRNRDRRKGGAGDRRRAGEKYRRQEGRGGEKEEDVGLAEVRQEIAASRRRQEVIRQERLGGGGRGGQEEEEGFEGEDSLLSLELEEEFITRYGEQQQRTGRAPLAKEGGEHWEEETGDDTMGQEEVDSSCDNSSQLLFSSSSAPPLAMAPVLFSRLLSQPASQQMARDNERRLEQWADRRSRGQEGGEEEQEGEEEEERAMLSLILEEEGELYRRQHGEDCSIMTNSEDRDKEADQKPLKTHRRSRDRGNKPQDEQRRAVLARLNTQLSSHLSTSFSAASSTSSSHDDRSHLLRDQLLRGKGEEEEDVSRRSQLSLSFDTSRSSLLSNDDDEEDERKERKLPIPLLTVSSSRGTRGRRTRGGGGNSSIMQHRTAAHQTSLDSRSSRGSEEDSRGDSKFQRERKK